MLLDKGYKVYGSTRSLVSSQKSPINNLIENKNLELVECNFFNYENTRSLLDYCKPNIIFHLASESSVAVSFNKPFDTFKGSTLVTINILEALKNMENQASLIHASSSECFGNINNPINEKTAFEPLSPYAVAKCASSQMIRIYNEGHDLNVANAFLFNHESIFRGDNFVTKKILKHAYECKFNSPKVELYGNLSVKRDWGLAREYTEALHLISDQVELNEYVIGSGKASTLRSFVKNCFDFYDLNYKDYVEESAELFRPNEVMITVADPLKINNELGWKYDKCLMDMTNELSEQYANYRIKNQSRYAS